MIPVLARTRMGLCAVRAALPSPVVLVPTMGALHDGHRLLLRRARELARPGGSVVVSVFVNPLQFGPGEDFDRYPRALEADMAVCAAEGAAAVFAPGQEQMYPAEQMITVSPGPMGRVLEGTSRPGFFAGVLTVVLKLFQLIRPDIAVFGQKDAQQLALIRRMSADLDLAVRIAAAPIVRDPDGLASSSRNAYLSAPERAARAGAAARAAGRIRRRGRGPGRGAGRGCGRAGGRGRRGSAGAPRLPGARRPGHVRRGGRGLRRTGAAAGRGAGRIDPADRQRRARASARR